MFLFFPYFNFIFFFEFSFYYCFYLFCICFCYMLFVFFIYFVFIVFLFSNVSFFGLYNFVNTELFGCSSRVGWSIYYFGFFYYFPFYSVPHFFIRYVMDYLYIVKDFIVYFNRLGIFVRYGWSLYRRKKFLWLSRVSAKNKDDSEKVRLGFFRLWYRYWYSMHIFFLVKRYIARRLYTSHYKKYFNPRRSWSLLNYFFFNMDYVDHKLYYDYIPRASGRGFWYFPINLPDNHYYTELYWQYLCILNIFYKTFIFKFEDEFLNLFTLEHFDDWVLVPRAFKKKRKYIPNFKQLAVTIFRYDREYS